MTFESLVSDACARFPEVKMEAEAQRKAGNVYEDIGQHIFFSFVFDKVLFWAIDTNNDQLSKRMFGFVEEMEKNSDHHIQEVAEFTVIEELCDNYRNAQFEKYLGPETKLALKAIRRYMPEQA